jgi:(p)ppGpp synthase/HD superfamily hydrolase
LKDRISQATGFAAEAHKGQTRNWVNEPYILHPLRVMELVKMVTGDEDVLVAALLHDTVEDCGVSLTTIELKFGAAVAKLVWEMTNCKARPETKDHVEATRPNRTERKRRDREFLALASPEAQTIKLADIIDNAGDIRRVNPGFAKTYIPELQALVAVLTKGHPDLILRAQRLLENEAASGPVPWGGERML